MVGRTLALTGVTPYQTPDGAFGSGEERNAESYSNKNSVDLRHTYGCRMVRVDILNFAYRSLLLNKILIEINDVKCWTGQLDQE